MAYTSVQALLPIEGQGDSVFGASAAHFRRTELTAGTEAGPPTSKKSTGLGIPAFQRPDSMRAKKGLARSWHSMKESVPQPEHSRSEPDARQTVAREQSLSGEHLPAETALP